MVQQNMSVRNRFAGLRDRVVGLLKRSAGVMDDVVPHLGDESAGNLSASFQERASKVRDEEFVVVVVGEMNRGKSMLLNAMMHKQLLAMDVLECTATVNFLRYPKPGQSTDNVMVHFTDGRPPEEVPVGKLKDYTSRLSALGNDEVANLVHHVDVFVESRFLEQNILLVDTPGTNTTTENHIQITYDQIDRSNAAIFLLDAETQMTKSDRDFLKEVDEVVSRLFFVVNKMDKIDASQVDRVLVDVEEKVKGAIADPSKLRPIFGMSAAQAMLGRTGYTTNGFMDEAEWRKQDSPQFRQALVEKSGIVAFEDDLARYLFGGEKGRDLLHNPLSFIQSETAKIEQKLHRQIEVLDDTFDLPELEQQIEKTGRVITDRKRELEGMTDELSDNLSSALSEVDERLDEKCKLEEESLKDTIHVYDSPEALKDNWNTGACIATLPERKLTNLKRQASKLINDAVERVLRQTTRTIRTRIRGELGEISLELPELPEMTFELQEPQIDADKKIKKLTKQLEDCEQELVKLDAAHAGINELHYNELLDRQQRLKEERINEIQLLGERPEVRYESVTKEKERPVRGILGGLKWCFVGKPRVEYEKKIKDDEERREHEKRRASIEGQYKEKLAEIDRRVEEARGKFDQELLEKRQGEQQEKLSQNLQQAREKEESRHSENEEKARQRAVKSTRGQLVSAFRDAAELLKSMVENNVRQTRDMATSYIDKVMEELDTTLTANKRELEKLESLKDAKESDRDALKEGITKALEELKTLREEASSLLDDHDAFIAESGEATGTEVKQ